ncbi:hypothetical protein F5B17DRAFT_429633 [Nemania serpens]|nr:hypothetical protein F5B17DRAFT_429633 [Nemania serpens]
MSASTSAFIRALSVLLGYSIYLAYYHGAGSPLAATNATFPSATAARAIPSATLTAEGLWTPSSGRSRSYNADVLTLFNFVQCYVAFQVLILQLWPFWNFCRRGFKLRRLILNLLVGWGLSFLVYVGVAAIRDRYHLALAEY